MSEALKEKQAKPRMDLVPGQGLEAVARILTHGAKKHGDASWKDYPTEAFLAAVGRHWARLLDGETIDPEFGESHWAHMATTCLFMADRYAEATASVSAPKTLPVELTDLNSEVVYNGKHYRAGGYVYEDSLVQLHPARDNPHGLLVDPGTRVTVVDE